MRSKKSLSTVFLFFLSRLPFFFCFFSRKRLLVFAAFDFFLKNNNNTCEIHSHAIVEKKRRREFLWLFQFLWLFSLRKRAI